MVKSVVVLFLFLFQNEYLWWEARQTFPPMNSSETSLSTPDQASSNSSMLEFDMGDAGIGVFLGGELKLLELK